MPVAIIRDKLLVHCRVRVRGHFRDDPCIRRPLADRVAWPVDDRHDASVSPGVIEHCTVFRFRCKNADSATCFLEK